MFMGIGKEVHSPQLRKSSQEDFLVGTFLVSQTLHFVAWDTDTQPTNFQYIQYTKPTLNPKFDIITKTGITYSY